jgi:hypothetical protein
VPSSHPPTEASSRQRQRADQRLPQALAGLLVLVLLTTGLGWAFLGGALRSLESVFRDRVEALALLHTVNDEMQHLVTDMAVKAERGVVARDSAARVIRTSRVRADSAWQAYLRTRFTPAESLLVARVTPAVERGFAQAAVLADSLAQEAAPVLAPWLERDVMPDLDGLSSAVREIVALQVRVTQEAYDLSRARYGIAGQAFLGAIVGACVLVLVALLAGGRRGPIPLRRWRR